MGKRNLKKVLWGTCYLCCMMLTACVNRINMEDEENENSTGDLIPISFTVQIDPASATTKVKDNLFEKEDKVGLFATLVRYTLAEKRYIDNLKLEYADNATLVPERDVFYPEGNAALNFFAYYPYQSDGLATGSCLLPVSVQTDQSDNSLSDFLTATATQAGSTQEAVTLSFKHKFAKLKIELLPQNGITPESFKQANPKIMAAGFKTQALYNIQTDSFENLQTEEGITPSGEWITGTDRLTGLEIIVIPQPIGKQAFTIEWDGTLYTCPIPLSEIKGNTQYTIQIKATQQENHLLGGIVAGIENWQDAEEGDNNESTSSNLMSYISISGLSFSNSHVYRIYNEGEPVAEICKEYLRSTGASLDAQAIVVYPVENDRTVLTDGTVLQIIEETAPVHGGKISWETMTNTPTYTPGTSAAIPGFYLNADKEVCIEQPDTPLEVNISSYTLRDIRKNEVTTYPIVKIGTQYWMRKELTTDCYNDGTPLTQRASAGTGAGYFVSENGKMYFYNGEALLDGELAPEGWKIPLTEDWEKLITYVGSASALKTYEWQSTTEGGEVCPVTNKSYFSAYPIGAWTNTQQLMYKMVSYWTVTESGDIAEQTCAMIGESNTFEMINTLVASGSYYKGMAIRCLMK